MSYVEQKIRAGFHHLDADGDGLLTKQDHVLVGERTAAAFGHQPGSEPEKQLVEAYVSIWTNLHEPKDVDGDGAVSEEEFVAATLSMPTHQGSNVLEDLARSVFDIVDVDSSGGITLREYRAFAAGHAPNLSSEDIEVAFAHLDRDGDGSISRSELAAAIVEYWASSDTMATGNWLFGTPPTP
jgi:Ca2+-binding EF-hand superfamily protein